MNVLVNPISFGKDRSWGEGARQGRNLIDSKVHGVVLPRIVQGKGGLLPSLEAPQVLIDLLPVFEQSKMGRNLRRKNKLRKTPHIRGTPIGLESVDSEGWLNALMQFVLFVPGFAELFSFMPRSFSPFREFIDQYYEDQAEQRPVSLANGIALFRFFTQKLPSVCFQEAFQFLFRILCPQWPIHNNLEEALEKGESIDLFVKDGNLKKQVFVERGFFYYDLDAFIELRPDGISANFVTYVKLNGVWYQCDEDRITLLRSNHLNIPLHQAVLLHYKRGELMKREWV